MKANEGSMDRALRIIAGIALITLAYTGKIGMWGYIGIIPLLTGILGICPVYAILGINTCPLKNK